MQTTGMIKKGILAICLISICSCASAHRWHRHPHVPPRPVATTIVVKPAPAPPIQERFTPNERFAMALAYLKKHKQLSSKKYAQLTGLTKARAEAELDAFAADKRKPIALVIKGRKKTYILRPQ